MSWYLWLALIFALWFGAALLFALYLLVDWTIELVRYRRRRRARGGLLEPGRVVPLTRLGEPSFGERPAGGGPYAQ